MTGVGGVKSLRTGEHRTSDNLMQRFFSLAFEFDALGGVSGGAERQVSAVFRARAGPGRGLFPRVEFGGGSKSTT